MLTDVKMGAARVELVEKIRQTIMHHTTMKPMPAEDIAMALGFVTGMAIDGLAKQQRGGRLKPRDFRQLIIANMDKGLELAQLGDKAPAIILPN